MIYVLTYNFPHKKTQDLLFKLKLKDYDVTVIASPWEAKKIHKPLLPHRFFKAEDIYPKDLCIKLGFNYQEINSMNELPTDGYILIGGAGIIPKESINSKKIINSHPGYLPMTRGLDSLKWAIFKGEPIGVTTHAISNEVDLGWLINRKILPLYHWDTFHSVAYKQYKLEVEMLSNSIEDLKNCKLESLSEQDLYEPQQYIGEVNKRMPHKYELKLLKKFDSMIENYND